MPRFVEDSYHSNFGLQWNRFSKVQLDSCNGTNESEEKLFSQSSLTPADLRGKVVLEVGAGNGRFTEILLKYGAKVIAVDYSTAIDANISNHHGHFESGHLLALQADLFHLPLREHFFDFVVCYGVIQHTGHSEKALKALSKFPKKGGGALLLDHYAISLRHFNPLVYLMRLFFFLTGKDDESKLKIVRRFVRALFPVQRRVLTFLHGKTGPLKLIRYIVNRSPNSVYGITLYLDGKINIKTAYRWCILDTFDSWAPRHDHPVSAAQWRKMIQSLEKNANFKIDRIGASGQGHTAWLTKL